MHTEGEEHLVVAIDRSKTSSARCRTRDECGFDSGSWRDVRFVALADRRRVDDASSATLTARRTSLI
jgi:hypothetical protein